MKVLVAMSGGVDSSVAAALLRDEGHRVVGVTMRLWGGVSDTGCCSVADVDDARRVAQQLGIDHVVFNFTEDFDARVVDPYVADHGSGRTPNPCIECNRHLKFDRLLRRAELLGFDAVATGHHARVVTDGHGRLHVGRGVDRRKDQSYVVHVIGAADLVRIAFPVGALTKAQVRARAAELGLRTAAKPESQDVCFVTDAAGRERFLAQRIALHPARVVDTAGTVVATLPAIEMVTIGQRRGLRLPGGGPKRYVVDVDIDGGTVVVGSEAEVARTRQALDGLRWARPGLREELGGAVLAQCSAHGVPQRAVVDDGDVLHWEEPQRRVAPGQAVVLYDPTDTRVVGAGVAAR